MSRAVVTPELTEIIRTIRIENRILSKDLAASINKSTAYISKFEKGDIKTIDTDDLYTILQLLFCDDNDQGIIEKIYQSLRIKYSREEIAQILWFKNYDTVDRKIPVPEGLIDYINTVIIDNHISKKHLLFRINANESLPEETKTDPSIPFNRWFHTQLDDGRHIDQIKIHMSLDRFESILNKGVEKAPYIDLLCIVFYILKTKKYNEAVLIDPEENDALMQEASNTLSKYKFYTVSERQEYLSLKRASAAHPDLLNSEDITNLDLINEIVSGFHFYSEYDVKLANKRLKAFDDNMHWDLGFMMRIISMDFAGLQAISVDRKQEIINEIDKLIIHYAGLPDEKKLIESY